MIHVRLWRPPPDPQSCDSPRQLEVLTGQGKPVADAVWATGVREATYYRRRAEHGGLKLDQVRWLKVLEQENGRLRRAVADLTLEKSVLKEAAPGNLRHHVAAATTPLS